MATNPAAGAPALAALGAHVGLFTELARQGPATSAELAVRAGLVHRSVRDWLITMAVGGYLEYDPTTARFRPPADTPPPVPPSKPVRQFPV